MCVCVCVCVRARACTSAQQLNNPLTEHRSALLASRSGGSQLNVKQELGKHLIFVTGKWVFSYFLVSGTKNLARSNLQEGYSLPISFGIAHLLEGYTVHHGVVGFVYGGCLEPWHITLVVDWTINLNTLSSSSIPVIPAKSYLLKNPQPPKSASPTGGQVFKHMRENI